MRFLVVLSCLLAVIYAKPSGVAAPVAYASLAAAPIAYTNIAPAPIAYTGVAAAPVTYSAYSVSTNAIAAPIAAPVVQTVTRVAAPAVAVAPAVNAAPAVAVADPPAVTAAPAVAAAAPAAVAAPVAAAAPAAVAAPVVAAAPAVVAPAVTRTVATPAVATAVAAPVLAAPVVQRTQYHAQDELGQASYGHSEPLQVHNAVQDAAGNKVGSYSYVAPDGQIIAANYVADGLGYRVASNALPVAPAVVPVAPVDTPEVAAARAAHLQEVAVARSRTRRSVAAYSAPVVSSYAYTAPVYRSAILSSVVNTPGHALSYRVY